MIDGRWEGVVVWVDKGGLYRIIVMWGSVGNVSIGTVMLWYYNLASIERTQDSIYTNGY